MKPDPKDEMRQPTDRSYGCSNSGEDSLATRNLNLRKVMGGIIVTHNRDNGRFDIRFREIKDRGCMIRKTLTGRFEKHSGHSR
jgi:hypothetical protein